MRNTGVSGNVTSGNQVVQEKTDWSFKVGDRVVVTDSFLNGLSGVVVWALGEGLSVLVDFGFVSEHFHSGGGRLPGNTGRWFTWYDLSLDKTCIIREYAKRRLHKGNG
jgi:hypothetical protein